MYRGSWVLHLNCTPDAQHQRGCEFTLVFFLFAAHVPAEHITIGMQLLSSLLLLGGGAFLSAHGPQLVSACAAYVGEVVERGLLLMLPPMDLLLVAAPQQAAPMMLHFMQVCQGPRGLGSRSVLTAVFFNLLPSCPQSLCL